MTRAFWLGVALVLMAVSARAEVQRETLRAARVRFGPGVYHRVVERISKGEKVTVLVQGERWHQVQTRSGKQGWVSYRVFLERPQPKGFQKVLQERALKGSSTTVATVVTRGLSGVRPLGRAKVDEAAREFLLQVPFDPGDYSGFASVFERHPDCRRLAAGIELYRRQVEGDEILDDLERSLGLALAGRLLAELKPVRDPALDAYVNMVGTAVAESSSRYDLPWRFVVFRQDAIEALSLPGGFVFVSTGLMGKLTDEAELAGVLAHEVAHVALAHGSKALGDKDTQVHVASDDSFGDLEAEAMRRPGYRDTSDVEEDLDRLVHEAYRMVRRSHGSKAELEADVLGTLLAACAGYDPTGLSRALERLEDFERHGADYPSCPQRVERMEEAIQGTGLSGGKKLKQRFQQSSPVPPADNAP